MKQERKIWLAIILLFALVFLFAYMADAQIRNVNWKKVGLNVGGSLLSIGLEMTGDALYDMGKASGNKSQMQWGHTLQATGYVVPLITIPILVRDSKERVWEDITIIVVTYGLNRYATADLYYNLTAGLDPLYAGVTTEHDNIMSKMPPFERALTKGFSFGVGFVININYWR